jgi:cell division protein FtsB
VAKQRTRTRPARSSLALRWLAVGALVLVGLLYYRPVSTYLERRAALADRRADVRTLEAQHRSLERRHRYVLSEAAVGREARRLGYVKPGERLFIVKGIPAWRAQREGGATIAGDGR